MSTIVKINDEKLQLKITQYGLGRIAEAVANPSLTLNITKIRLGNGRDEKYYDPSETQTSLEGDLDLEFYIYDKALLEDEVTISFHTIIPDSVGGFDIREVGLYETVNGEDKLFAISTQQPFVKPTTADNYFINIDYYIFLKATQFKDIYDQIVLDSNYALVTEPNLEELMKTFLFAHGNLINQIGNNSRIIGYNRPTQLYDIIKENKKDYSYITLYKTYASLVDVTNPDNIFSYWAFDYSRRTSSQNSVTDLSNNRFALDISKNLNRFEHIYNGFMSMFSIEDPDYFKLSSQIPLNLFGKVSEDSTEETDFPFTMIFAVEPLTYNSKRTLLAKSDYLNRLHTFEVNELADGSLELKLFSSYTNYLTFTSSPRAIPNAPHSIVLTYDPDLQEVIAYINSTKYNMTKVETGTYTHMNETPGILYCFTYTPEYKIYANATSPSIPTALYNENGTPYIGPDWQVSEGVVEYKGALAPYDEDGDIQTDKLYAWVYNDTVNDHIIYTKTLDITQDTVLYNSDYTEYAESLFSISYVEGTTPSYKIFYEQYPTTQVSEADIEPQDRFCYKATLTESSIYTNSIENPILLYTQVDDSYEIYTGTQWTIGTKEVNEQEVPWVLFEGNPGTRGEDTQTFTPDLTSYIIDANGAPAQFINSNVGLVSIIKEKLSEDNARIMALNLCATMGRNPYLSGS